jgi:hypothetical protein
MLSCPYLSAMIFGLQNPIEDREFKIVDSMEIS